MMMVAGVGGLTVLQILTKKQMPIYGYFIFLILFFISLGIALLLSEGETKHIGVWNGKEVDDFPTKKYKWFREWN